MTLADGTARRLPSGRHHLSRADVAASQRRRLLESVVAVVGEKGWSATRIADVVAAAEVSRQTFYQQFPSLDACYAEALETGLGELLARLDDEVAGIPVTGPSGLTSRLRAFFDGYVAALGTVPGLPRAVHVETLRSTDLVRSVRARVITLLADRIARAYEASRKSGADLPPLPDSYFRMLTGGLDELFRELIRDQGETVAMERFASEATELAAVALRGAGDPSRR